MIGDIRGRALWVVLACAVAQLGLGTAYSGSVLVPAMLDEFGWSRGDFMAAGSPRLIVAALASPLVGALTYRFGARPILIGAVFLIGGVFSLYAAVQSLGHVFALALASGLIIAGVGDIVVGTVISQWVVRGRGLALGIVYSGSNLGGLLFSLLAAQVLLASDWRMAYVAVGLVALIVLLPVVTFCVREPRPDERGLPLDEDTGSEVASAPGLTLSEAMRTRSFWLLLAALFTFFFYYTSVSAHLVLFLTDLGMSTWEASASFGLTIFLGIGAKVGIGLIADRWPPKTALLINFGVVTAASFILLMLPAKGLLPLFVVAHGLATAAQNVVYPLMVAWCFGVEHMAKIYGVLMLALLPGGTLGPIFAGYMFEAVGSYDLAFQIFAGLNVVSFVGLCLVRSAAAGGRVVRPRPA